MTPKDTLQRFLITDQPVRLEIIRLQKTYDDISQNHPYPFVIKTLLGEALAATALLSGIIKFAGKLTLQIQSQGPINFLVAQSDHKYHLRGLVQWREELPNDAIKKTFAEGHLGITIAPEAGESYQGLVKLAGDNLAISLETYFRQSEQLPTGIYLAADENSVIGILIQIIPGNINEEQSKFWHTMSEQLNHLNSHILSTSNDEILQILAPGQKISLVNDHPVKFHCDCTVERMERAIKILGQEEANDILKTNKYVTVTCEFCNKQHDFSATDVAKIFNDKLNNQSSLH